MKTMIRLLKGTIAVLALAAVAVLLRWITAGSITGVRTYDLDSLTVLAVSAVAWIAYAWLVLAVLATALEQLPGIAGALAGALAGRITTGTARTLLRSGLGVAAVTPLTITGAHASPTPIHSQSVEPPSTLKLAWAPTSRTSDHPGSTNDTAAFRATEPPSTVKLGAAHVPEPNNPTWGPTEPPSTIRLTESRPTPHAQRTQPAHPNITDPRQPDAAGSGQPDAAGSGQADAAGPGQADAAGSGQLVERRVGGAGRLDAPTRRTGPGAPGTPGRGSTPGHGAVGGRPTSANHPAGKRPTEDHPGGTRQTADQPTRTRPTADEPASERPVDRRLRIGVPDRPTAGAPTRYTDVRAATAIRVVVRAGDSLWSLAARELGTGATDATIATRWLDWYAANRQAIGHNPNLLVPGQVLQVPQKHGGGLPSTGGNHLPPTQGDHLPPTHQEN
ncbi:LysM peptidoglycan-binding domain-containing protein [Kribbella solani]|uniref:Nucleoid-associated protein YgaU n=1 Tax=Kribbella solani TaxID=236067 RepID=A0A841DU90_9ACTN|nr:LysM domain-containing protein [Kribbella solani]MBB5980445.1 nucleoid-associated protein YgaU [Kribbella solani]